MGSGGMEDTLLSPLPHFAGHCRQGPTVEFTAWWGQGMCGAMAQWCGRYSRELAVEACGFMCLMLRKKGG